MNVRQRVLLMIALIAAIGVALLVFGMMGNRSKPTLAQPVVAMTRVLVAARDIPPGMPLTTDMVTWESWPQSTVPVGFLTGDGSAEGLKRVVGTVSRAHILAGEPLTNGKILKSDSAGYMAATLTPGMRAVALPVSISTAAGGFVQPGNHVDVLLTRIRDTRPDTDIILTDIRVLAIDQTSGQDRSTGDNAKDKSPGAVRAIQTVTLELTPEQTKELAQAKALGSLSLALRPLATQSGNSEYDTSGPIVIIRGDAKWRGK